MKNYSIAIIGCGNLGTAILSGLVKSPFFDNKNITVTTRTKRPISNIFQDVTFTTNNVKAISTSDIVIICLKPYNVNAFLDDNKEILKNKIIISCATGISINSIKLTLDDNNSIYRAMPNTSAGVSESITCISSLNKKNDKEEIVKEIFEQIGQVVFIDEQLMDAATVLGACGIAFVLRFIRAMIQGGVQIGFDAKTATTIVNQTVKGAATLLIEGKNHPEYEIDKVTTPKGCTIAGLNEMEHNGFSSALIKGIISSFDEIEK